METRANYVAIGLFVLAVIVGVFGFIYWLARTSDTGTRATVVIEFEGSVTGLAEGGLVLFNGIKIGEVKTIKIKLTDPNMVQAFTRVDSSNPIKTDTKATLGFQGLTGVAHIALKGGSIDAKSIFDSEGIPLITADRSAFENLVEGAQSVLTRADRALEVIEEMVVGNRDNIDQTVANVQQFSDALAKNSKGVDQFLSEVSRAADAFAGLSDKMESLITSTDALVKAVDTDQVAKTIDNVATFSDSLAGASKDVDAVVADFRNAADQLSNFGDNLNKTLERADKIVAGVDPEKIGRTVDSVDKFAATLSKRSDEIDKLIVEASGAAGNINKLTAKLAERDGDIDQIVTDVRSAVERFNAFSGDLNTAMKDVKGLLAAVDTEKVGRVVSNVDEFTSKLAGRGDDIDEIIGNARSASANVQKFTDSVAAKQADVDRIFADAREFANRLNAVSVRVESVLGKVEGLIEGDGEGFVAEATAAARSIRIAAETFQSRAGNITRGLERFSTRGVRDFEAMMSQGRQTLSTIERAFSEFDKQPNRVIFGGSSRPTYKRR